MKMLFICIVLISMLTGCKMETFNIQRGLNNRIGYVEIHKCFCGPSAYRYLIVNPDKQDSFKYNPVKLPEEYSDDNYKIVFSADLLTDSSIVYTNSPTDALIEDFRVRNIKL